jgi:hypothetical protein
MDPCFVAADAFCYRHASIRFLALYGDGGGLPVVAFDQSEAVEALKDGAGLIVPYGDAGKPLRQ